MAYLSQLVSLGFQNARQTLASCNINNSLVKVCIRHASKKSSTSTRNKGGHPRPKHRGWKVQDGAYTYPGRALVTQRTPRFHPGLNVGCAKNGSLYAIEPGKVVVTCEKVDLNWKHPWVKRFYAGRENQVIYKKHFNIIPDPQHNTFKLIDTI